MWVFVITSFTRYNKVGRKARMDFHRSVLKDGFFHLHENLYVRYCTTSRNAIIHKERIKRIIPQKCCDISIILSSDGNENNIYHSLNRKRSRRIDYGKHENLEFF